MPTCVRCLVYDIFLCSVPSDIKVTVAVITASASACVALVGFISSLIALKYGRNSQFQVERLKADLESTTNEQDARRDYEYEARKRLYSQCDPAAFRMLEECDRAYTRIVTLAQIARSEEGSRWITDEENRLSTLYRVTAPIAAFAVLREQLTLFDLALEPRIHLQYRLGLLMVETFHHDVGLARIGASLQYRPGAEETSDSEAAPEIYTHQGISYEDLDSVVHALLEETANGLQLISYPKFKQGVASEGSAAYEAGMKMDYLLRDFTPLSRPVLWRLLLVQAILCQMMGRSTVKTGNPTPGSGTLLLTMEDQGEIELQLKMSEADTHFAAALEFLSPRVAKIDKALSLRIPK
jgi:hypothetical protein